MVIEASDSSQQIITINGDPYVINVKEYESFLQQCSQFMSADENGFETMIQIIADNLLDNASPDTTIEELRPQLKFLREISFLFRNLVTPAMVNKG